jgi:hypothetical protein
MRAKRAGRVGRPVRRSTKSEGGRSNPPLPESKGGRLRFAEIRPASQLKWLCPTSVVPAAWSFKKILFVAGVGSFASRCNLIAITIAGSICFRHDGLQVVNRFHFPENL